MGVAMHALARGFLVALPCAWLALSSAHAADPAKVLRIASSDITSLDPQQGTDIYSTRVAGAIFEGLYQYDYLSEPAKIVPNTAAAMPEIADGGRTWTIRLQRGIRFADDPAFKGKPRELVAGDYVYAIKRAIDPTLKGGGDPAFSDLIVGARAVVDAAKRGRFDYDAPIAGLAAPDAHTLVIRTTAVDYTLLERLAGLATMAVAREAVEAAGADVLTRPVGTGPYMLKEWRKGSRVVLEANPNYRKLAFPASTNPAHKALVERMRGVALPAIGRIEIAIIEEFVPMLLAFEKGELDYIGMGGSTLGRMLQPDGKVKPELAERGVTRVRQVAPYLVFVYFNMEDRDVGGYAPDRVALRRAIGMGFDTPTFIRVMYAGEAEPASQLLPPHTEGHDPTRKTSTPYDPAAARALLDRFGWRDRDGDGYRETPEGKPFTLVHSSTPDSWSREADTLWLKSMEGIGIRMRVNTAPFPDLLKQSLAGRLPMFNMGYRALDPSGYEILSTLWGKSPPDTNRSRFRLAEYDAAYEAFLRTPPGPARNALVYRMSDLAVAYAPMSFQLYTISNVFVHPWVKGYAPSPFGFSWKYLDVDPARRAGGANAR
jgi:ABC-type transport system substrate-binding protein